MFFNLATTIFKLALGYIPLSEWNTRYIDSTYEKNDITHVASLARDAQYCNWQLDNLADGIDVTKCSSDPHNYGAVGNRAGFECFKYDKTHSRKQYYRAPRTTFTPKVGKYFDFWWQSLSTKVSGLNVFCRHDSARDKIPYPEAFLLRYHLYYKPPHGALEDFILVTENGKPKVFQYGGFRRHGSRLNGGFEFVEISPNIVTNHLRIKVIYTRILMGKWRCYFNIYGCYDHQAFRELQQLGGYTMKKNAASAFRNIVYFTDGSATTLDPTECCAVFDFEKGSGLSNWTVEGKAFQNQPTYKDTKFLREKKKLVGVVGDWWVSSREKRPHPSAPVMFQALDEIGSALSPPFIVTSTEYTFLVGGKGGQVGVELIVHKKVVRKYEVKEQEQSENALTMKRQSFKVTEYFGQPARIRLYDNNPRGFLMFDDFRTSEKCSLYSQPLGMTNKSAISKQHITGMKPYADKHPQFKKYEVMVKDPKFSADHARLSTDAGKPEIFKVLYDPDTKNPTPAAYLQIDLVKLHLLDGWATQTYSKEQRDREGCELDRYIVRYQDNNENWRYVSAVGIFESDGHTTPMAVTIGFEHEYEKTGPSINRKYLNPRLRAKAVRFVITSNSHHFVTCFRVELYGYRIEDQFGIVDKHKTLHEKQQQKQDEYKLQVINVASRYTKFGKLLLPCFNETDVIGQLDHHVVWIEQIFNSNLVLNVTGREAEVPLAKGFGEKVFRCNVYHSSLDTQFIFTREFLLIEKEQRLIVPFVTQEAGPEYRGGRLVHTNPAVFLNEGFWSEYFSVNLANVISPMVMQEQTVRYCPSGLAKHRAFDGYQVCDRASSKMFDCIEKGVHAGDRYFLVTPTKVWSGPMVYSWQALKKGHQERCAPKIFSKYKREFGTPCSKSCAIAETSDRGKGDFYRTGYTSVFTYLKITLHRNDEVKPFFSQTYTLDDILKDLNSQLLKPNHNNPTQTLQYNDCKSAKRPRKQIDEFSSCHTYLSMHATRAPLVGSLLTFVYLNGLPSKEIHKRRLSQVTMRGEYKNKKTRKIKHFIKRVNINHVSKPVIELPAVVGVCQGQHREVDAKVVFSDMSFADTNLFIVTWFRVRVDDASGVETLKKVGDNLDTTTKAWMYVQKTKLILYYARAEHEGIYEVRVLSPFEESYARTKIVVHSDYPHIVWKTPSPHIVVTGQSDILEIRTNNDKDIDAIDWYKDDKLIQQSNHHSFIDYNGQQYQKKRLVLMNAEHKDLSGSYVAILKGVLCEFTAKINVIVHLQPSISITPDLGKKDYMVMKTDESLVLRAKVKGGKPAVVNDGIYWMKDGTRLVGTSKGRIRIEAERTRDGSWTSKLTVQIFTLYDAGFYQFVAKAGEAQTEVSRKIIFLR